MGYHGKSVRYRIHRGKSVGYRGMPWAVGGIPSKTGAKVGGGGTGLFFASVI